MICEEEYVGRDMSVSEILADETVEAKEEQMISGNEDKVCKTYFFTEDGQAKPFTVKSWEDHQHEQLCKSSLIDHSLGVEMCLEEPNSKRASACTKLERLATQRRRRHSRMEQRQHSLQFLSRLSGSEMSGLYAMLDASEVAQQQQMGSSPIGSFPSFEENLNAQHYGTDGPRHQPELYQDIPELGIQQYPQERVEGGYLPFSDSQRLPASTGPFEGGKPVEVASSVADLKQKTMWEQISYLLKFISLFKQSRHGKNSDRGDTQHQTSLPEEVERNLNTNSLQDTGKTYAMHVKSPALAKRSGPVSSLIVFKPRSLKHGSKNEKDALFPLKLRKIASALSLSSTLKSGGYPREPEATEESHRSQWLIQSHNAKYVNLKWAIKSGLFANDSADILELQKEIVADEAYVPTVLKYVDPGPRKDRDGKPRRSNSFAWLFSMRQRELEHGRNLFFRERLPMISENLTLGKIISLKEKTIALFLPSEDKSSSPPSAVKLEVSTVALAFVYFEKLIFKRAVSRQNCSLVMANCIVLAHKFNGINRSLLPRVLVTLEKGMKVSRKAIFKHEFEVYRLLMFQLKVAARQWKPHLQCILERVKTKSTTTSELYQQQESDDSGETSDEDSDSKTRSSSENSLSSID